MTDIYRALNNHITDILQKIMKQLKNDESLSDEVLQTIEGYIEMEIANSKIQLGLNRKGDSTKSVKSEKETKPREKSFYNTFKKCLSAEINKFINLKEADPDQFIDVGSLAKIRVYTAAVKLIKEDLGETEWEEIEKNWKEGDRTDKINVMEHITDLPSLIQKAIDSCNEDVKENQEKIKKTLEKKKSKATSSPSSNSSSGSGKSKKKITTKLEDSDEEEEEKKTEIVEKKAKKATGSNSKIAPLSLDSDSDSD